MSQTRILIVEDEAIVARDIAQQLARLGYEAVAQTPRGEQAIVLAEQLRPDLVLMDIKLADEMDGIVAAQAIRDQFAIPVVFLTVSAGDETVERAKLSEPFGYIVKPFHERELRIVIEMALYKHQAETRFRDRQEELMTILGTAMDGYWLADAEGRFLEVNDAYCQVTGYNREELLRMAIRDVEPDETPAEIAANIERIMELGSARFERRQRCKDGRLIHVEVSVNYLSRSGGRLVCFLRDITQRKQAEEDLRKLQDEVALRERQLKSFFQGATAGLALLDKDLRYVQINDTLAGMNGVPAKDHLGRTMREIVPQIASIAEPIFQKAFATGEAVLNVEFSGETRSHSGTWRHWMASFFPITGADGSPSTVGAIVVETTEQKRTEQQLLAANSRLAQAVVQAKELAVRADAANRAKSEFLANMSHEIRTPMTAILGFSDLLASPNVPYQERREFLAGIQRNAKALLELIGDILDLSRIEADRLTLEKTDCPLRQIIDDVLSVVQVRAEQKGLALEVEYTFPLPETIHTDPIRLRQILTNLAGNAVKFTDQGAVRIAVRLVNAENQMSNVEDAPRHSSFGFRHWQFAVSDTGIGIPADKLDELFDPFTQVDASASRHYGGTGLGLAICRRLARALGGDVEVASQLGRGSTFTLTIEAGSLEGVKDESQVTNDESQMTNDESQMSNDESQMSNDETSDLRHSGFDFRHSPEAAEEGAPSEEQEPTLCGRVLLVEDVPDVGVALRYMLRWMNLESDIAENGELACQMAEKSRADGRPYDLILMDIQMPGMNGYEATRWLRQHGWQGPIVALTAHALVGDREKCLEAGCNDYIAKPITGSGLRDALKRYFGGMGSGNNIPKSRPGDCP